MRRHKKRGLGSDKRVRMPRLNRHDLSDVVTELTDVGMNQSDKKAAAEGDSIIRRGQGCRSDKAFHDSILWNRNVRKLWIRGMLQLSDQTEILKVYLASGEK